jgi:hypothetical protein
MPTQGRSSKHSNKTTKSNTKEKKEEGYSLAGDSLTGDSLVGDSLVGESWTISAGA